MNDRRSAGFRRADAGFALWSALAVVLLFSFVVALLFMIIREGDRRVVRHKGDRAALNLAESASAVIKRRFVLTGATGPFPELELAGGKCWGEMKDLSEGKYQIRAFGLMPLADGESDLVVIVVDGTGDSIGHTWWQQAGWRFARIEERKQE